MMTGAEFSSSLDDVLSRQVDCQPHPAPADPLAPPVSSPSLPVEGSYHSLTYAGHGPPPCSGCSQPIVDQFIHQVEGQSWHAKCLRCATCGTSLSQTCYAGNGRLYCQQDFYRLFGTHCSACKVEMPPTELVRRAHGNVYHMNCFRCSVCAKELNTGDQFYLGVEGHLLCDSDYSAIQAKNLVENNTVNDDTNKLTDTQRTQILMEEYNQTQQPDRQTIERISGRTGMEPSAVRAWFKQRKAKTRRKGDDSENLADYAIKAKNNTVTPLVGGFPLPIVNKAGSTECAHTPSNCQSIPGTMTSSLINNASFGNQVDSLQNSHQIPHLPYSTPLITNINQHRRAWEQLWSDDFVPPNVDLEPGNLRNGEVVHFGNPTSNAESINLPNNDIATDSPIGVTATVPQRVNYITNGNVTFSKPPEQVIASNTKSPKTYNGEKDTESKGLENNLPNHKQNNTQNSKNQQQKLFEHQQHYPQQNQQQQQPLKHHAPLPPPHQQQQHHHNQQQQNYHQPQNNPQQQLQLHQKHPQYQPQIMGQISSPHQQSTMHSASYPSNQITNPQQDQSYYHPHHHHQHHHQSPLHNYHQPHHTNHHKCTKKNNNNSSNNNVREIDHSAIRVPWVR